MPDTGQENPVAVVFLPALSLPQAQSGRVRFAKRGNGACQFRSDYYFACKARAKEKEKNNRAESGSSVEVRVNKEAGRRGWLGRGVEVRHKEKGGGSWEAER